MNFWDVFGEMLVILFAIAAGYAANRLGTRRSPSCC